ncbi:hypothetical protein LNA02_06760 [Levilactobacillus namurensis]|nr:MarR family transcriptional regulator [Levilactobacillus namurensis]GEO73978.1 hypothetical protein LNA02_06760 [Levilactobacillus namurensis]
MDTLFEDNIGRNLKTLNNLVEKKLNNDLRSLGVSLTGTQMSVMMWLHNNQGVPLTQKQIETELKLSHPTTRGINKRLVEAGLIETQVVAEDKRQIQLQLTPKGRDLLDSYSHQLKMKVDAVEAKMLTGIDANTQTILLSSIRTMIRNME